MSSIDMNRGELESFVQKVRVRSRELAPDYPGIQNDLTPSEHLWAITASLEGTRLANNDMHEFAGFLIAQLRWTTLEAVERFNKAKGKK